jgi:uncharacterized protein YutD
MKIKVNNNEYDVIENYRDCFNLDELVEKMSDTDYFDDFDYILGDYSYEKLRLKGFYDKNNKNVNNINNYENIKKYIEDFCSYGCKYFILSKTNNNKDKTE